MSTEVHFGMRRVDDEEAVWSRFRFRAAKYIVKEERKKKKRDEEQTDGRKDKIS